MPWVPGAARSLIILSYLLLRASFDHFDLCMTIVYIAPSLFMHYYFERRGYANYLLRVMVVSGPYMLLVQFLFVYIFGVRRPDLWESRTVCRYTVHVFYCSYLWCWRIFLDWSWLVWLILLYIRIVGGWDWPGVGIWRIYMYELIISSIGAPSLYSDRVVCCPSNRWTLSVFLQKL